MGHSSREITELLLDGYNEFHRLAHRQLAQERTDHTLQTATLANKTYLTLTDREMERKKFNGSGAVEAN